MLSCRLLVSFLLFITLNSTCFAKTKNVVIVGGGMAGVSAAVFLQKGDYEVHLFEKEEQLGGHAQTLDVERDGKKVAIDVGPQYFAYKGWDAYIAFLEYFDLFHPKDRTLFMPDIVIYNGKSETLYFATPSLSRGERIASLNPVNLKKAINLLRFLFKTYKLHLHSGITTKKELTVGDWLDSFYASRSFKDSVMRPLIAAITNADFEGVDSISMAYVSQAMAFRNPLDTKYYVSNIGFGRLIEKIADKVEAESNRVHFHRGEGVVAISPLSDDPDRYVIISSRGEKIVADKLIMAIHPFDAAKLLPTTPEFEKMVSILNQFQYQKIFIAIHSNKSYAHPEISSFFNVNREEGNLYHLTMNLGTIGPNYKGIYKSWISTEEEIRLLQEKGELYGYSSFQHPVVTPQFLQLQQDLKKLTPKSKNLWYIGGWTTTFETQNTAILSAFKAISEMDLKLGKMWLKEIDQLSDINRL